MSLNSAVVAHRKSPAHALDFFPTPPWAVRALLFEVLVRFWGQELGRAWEPACGAGHCAVALADGFEDVFTSDVHDWGFGEVRDLDFCMAQRTMTPWPIDWVITNPPFALASNFVLRAFDIAQRGVAMLLRLQWWETEGRYHTFFGPHAGIRPVLVAIFSERVPMIEEVWDPEASTATAYAWFIFQTDGEHPVIPSVPGFTPTCHFPPGMAAKYSRPSDEALATRGEAKRRAKARKASAGDR